MRPAPVLPLSRSLSGPLRPAAALRILVCAALTSTLAAPARAAGLEPVGIHDAIVARDRLQVTQLLEAGVDLEEPDAYGRTPLYLASREGDTELVRELLARGARTEARTLAGFTPLHVASLRGHLDVARLLLTNCAEVDARDARGRTALHLAALRGHADVTELLLQDQAEVEVRGKSGTTPIAVAIAYRQRDTIDVLRASLPPLPVDPEDGAVDPEDGAVDPEEEAAEGDPGEDGTAAGEAEARPAPVAAAPPARPTVRVRESERPRGTRGTLLFVQEKLVELGYDPGPVNGERSRATLDAVRAFQDTVGQVRESELGQITRCLVDRLTVETERIASPSAGIPGEAPTAGVPSTYD